MFITEKSFAVLNEKQQDFVQHHPDICAFEEDEHGGGGGQEKTEIDGEGAPKGEEVGKDEATGERKRSYLS